MMSLRNWDVINYGMGVNSYMNSSQSHHVTASCKAFQWLPSLTAWARDPWGPWRLTPLFPIILLTLSSTIHSLPTNYPPASLSPGFSSGTLGLCTSLSPSLEWSFPRYHQGLLLCLLQVLLKYYLFSDLLLWNSISNRDVLEHPISPTLILFSHGCFYHLSL